MTRVEHIGNASRNVPPGIERGNAVSSFETFTLLLMAFVAVTYLVEKQGLLVSVCCVVIAIVLAGPGFGWLLKGVTP